MEKALNYSDVHLVPEYSELKSRAEADIGVEFLGRKFNSPVVPANMSSVIDINTAHWLSENGYFYIYHRFGDTLKFVKDCQMYFEGSKFIGNQWWKTISISIGVKQEDKDLIQKIINYRLKVDVICIDIAHGHHILVKEMIDYIKNTFVSYQYSFPCPKIIAGNVATQEAILDLEKWGADAVKVGIAGGGACSTKNQTGFHVPMFTCMQNCSVGTYIPIISDGGIRENGDIAKAITAGADMVMLGGALAACVDSPAENIHEPVVGGFLTEYPPKITHKKYFGSASYKNKGEDKHVEGFEVDIPCNGKTYEQKYKEIKESLQSAISYSGGTNLSSLKNVKWITTK